MNVFLFTFSDAGPAKCYDLAARWDALRESTKDHFDPADLASFSTSQKIVFLESLQNLTSPLPAATVKRLDEVYRLDESRNAELKLRFYGIALASGSDYAEKAAGGWLVIDSGRPSDPRVSAAWVTDKGRMKMCRVRER